MSTALLTLLLAASACMALAASAQDDLPRKAQEAPFEAMQKGIQSKDEAAFKAPWLETAYETNLVGRSGLAGKEVYAQGTRKKWYLRPDPSRSLPLGEGAAILVPCDVWAWEKERAVDKVDILLVKEKDGYRILGGGEKRAQVEALANRWLRKEPLEPPKEKE